METYRVRTYVNFNGATILMGANDTATLADVRRARGLARNFAQDDNHTFREESSRWHWTNGIYRYVVTATNDPQKSVTVFAVPNFDTTPEPTPYRSTFNTGSDYGYPHGI